MARTTTYAELAALLEEYVVMYPAFRSKPIGAPFSNAREDNELKIKLEDRALKALRTTP